MTRFIDCWISVATALFAQALAGEPELVEMPAALPAAAAPMAAGETGFTAIVAGDEEGQFLVILDPSILAASLAGEGMDQKAGWSELLREVAEAASGELLAKTGKRCRIEGFEEMVGESESPAREFHLKSHVGTWRLQVHDGLNVRNSEEREAEGHNSASLPEMPAARAVSQGPAGLSPGIELLLDVELEAALRFGCREMPLGEILDLGPGDVVELDR